MMRFTMFAVVFLFAVLPDSAFTQTLYRLQPGARISVFAPSMSDQPTAGRLEAIDESGLRMSLADGRGVTFARSDVTNIYVSTGMRSHTLTGTGIGALSGLALGATMVIVGSSTDDDSGIDSLDRAVYTAVMVITTVGGGVVGTIIGALTQTENWEEVAPSRLRWGLAPTLNGGVGVAFALRF